MKKAIIAILVIMMVFCSAAFADSGIENYTGLAVGFGISRSRIQDMENMRAYQLVFSITDFGFVEKSPIGLFLDGTLFIDTKAVEYTDYSEYEIPKEDLPVGVVGTIGPAFKLDMGKSLDLLLGLGFSVYRQSWVYSYGRWDEFYYGVGADVEFAYELGKSFSITIGADGAYYFANSRYFSDNHHKNIDVSYNKYWEYRIIPKVAAYYTF